MSYYEKFEPQFQWQCAVDQGRDVQRCCHNRWVECSHYRWSATDCENSEAWKVCESLTGFELSSAWDCSQVMPNDENQLWFVRLKYIESKCWEYRFWWTHRDVMRDFTTRKAHQVVALNFDMLHDAYANPNLPKSNWKFHFRSEIVWRNVHCRASSHLQTGRLNFLRDNFRTFLNIWIPASLILPCRSQRKARAEWIIYKWRSWLSSFLSSFRNQISLFLDPFNYLLVDVVIRNYFGH